MKPEDIEKYEKAIPDYCQLRTYQEHYDILWLCWGLLAAIDSHQQIKCGSCEFATRKENE